MTLEPAALIHEVWLKSQGEAAEHRAQFFAHASKGDAQRHRGPPAPPERRQARRAGRPRHALHWRPGGPPAPDVLQLDDVLQQLARADERAHQVVEMRFLGPGLTEIAQVLDISVPTVKRDWQRARAFLFEALQS